MRKKDVEVGRVYLAKVSDRVVPVRIDGVVPGKGWYATNTVTGRQIRVRTAARLRALATSYREGYGSGPIRHAGR